MHVYKYISYLLLYIFIENLVWIQCNRSNKIVHILLLSYLISLFFPQYLYSENCQVTKCDNIFFYEKRMSIPWQYSSLNKDVQHIKKSFCIKICDNSKPHSNYMKTLIMCNWMYKQTVFTCIYFQFILWMKIVSIYLIYNCIYLISDSVCWARICDVKN